MDTNYLNPNFTSYKDISNGCGPDGDGIKNRILSHIIPNGFFVSRGGFNFKDQCDFHDICYSIKGVSKEYCDNKFSEDLQSECNLWSSSDESTTYIGELWDKAANYCCESIASIYHFAVTSFGEEAYDAAQNQQ